LPVSLRLHNLKWHPKYYSLFPIVTKDLQVVKVERVLELLAYHYEYSAREVDTSDAAAFVGVVVLASIHASVAAVMKEVLAKIPFEGASLVYLKDVAEVKDASANEDFDKDSSWVAPDIVIIEGLAVVVEVHLDTIRELAIEVA